MKQFTVEEFREALFLLPELVACSRVPVAKMLLEEKITRRKLGEFDNMHPYTYLRETFLSDAAAKLLGIPKEHLNFWAGNNQQLVQELFDTRLGWTSEEWAIEFLNFAALHLTPNK